MKFLSSVLVLLSGAASINAQTPAACNTPTSFTITSAANNQYTFTTSAGGVYGQNPSLQLVAGTSYTFITNQVSTTDPFFIKTATGAGSANQYVPPASATTYGVLGNGNPTVYFAPDASLVGTTLYYQDGSNANINGAMTFVAASACPTGATTTTAATTTAATTTAATTTAAGTTAAGGTTAPGSTLTPQTNAPIYLSTPLGCYMDNTPLGTRLLTTQLLGTTTLTPQMCSDAAYANNYLYYGLEYGQQCWAGNTLAVTTGNALQTGTAATTLCSYPCGGLASATCGGYNGINVFSISKPPMPTGIASSAGQFSPLTFSASVNNVTLNVVQTQAVLAAPLNDLLPVYAPFGTTGTSMAILFLNCPTPACITAPQMVFLCIDAESCGYVGLAGYFTLPIVGLTQNTIYNKLRLLGTNGAHGDYFIIVNRYIFPTTAPPTSAAPTVFGQSQISAAVCLTDSAARVLGTQLGVSTSMTVNACKTLATTSNFKYFGVEYGVECYGSNSISYPVTTSTACTMPCGGDSTTMCGGIYAINVYEIYVPNANIANGCYVDSVTQRVLANLLLTANTGMTPQVCATAAKNAGYTYYGVEYASQCFADYAPAVTTLITSTSCNYQCSGDTAQFCGGYNAINIFKVV